LQGKKVRHLEKLPPPPAATEKKKGKWTSASKSRREKRRRGNVQEKGGGRKERGPVPLTSSQETGNELPLFEMEKGRGKKKGAAISFPILRGEGQKFIL